MKSWIALLKREYLEHRGAFLWLPLGLLALFTLAGLSALVSNSTNITVNGTNLVVNGTLANPVAVLKLFEGGYFASAVLWSAYLLAALFFYFGDAFHADQRNNSMLFWKSLPVSDLKILGSKFLAGILLFPAIIFLAALATGMMHFLLMGLAGLAKYPLAIPSLLVLVQSYLQISIFILGYLTLALLWYAPFFAWVGALSTMFGRWSLVLAFFIPGVLSLIEVIILGRWGQGSQLWRYLGERMKFGPASNDFSQSFLGSELSFDAATAFGKLLAGIDPMAMAEGLVFAAAVLFLASEYRRRRIA